MNLRQDNFYVITVHVNELDASYNIRVNDSTSVSKLIDDLIGCIALKCDWSDYSLWNENKRVWLLPKSSNLLPFLLSSDSTVYFLKRFRLVNIQLPDLQIRPMVLDFTNTVFQINKTVCSKLGINHHEELSFQCRMVNDSVCRAMSMRRIKNKTTFNRESISYWSLGRSTKSQLSPFVRSSTISQKINQPQINGHHNESTYFESFIDSKLANSPEITFKQALKCGDILSYKSYSDRSKLRFSWLISELTLMEQGINNFDKVLLLLRFKYHSYFYLNEKSDFIRINQIFHQAYWSVLSNETDCSEDEELVLGGLRLQFIKSSKNEKLVTPLKINKPVELDQEIYVLLDQLECELLGKYVNSIEDTRHSISGILYILRYPKYFFNTFTKHFATLKNDGIHLFSDRNKKPTEIIPIKGNQVELRVKLSKDPYFILEIYNLPNDRKMYAKEEKLIEKFKMKFFVKNDFIRWAAGCRLLAKSLDFDVLETFLYEYNVVANIVSLKLPIYSASDTIVAEEIENINLSDLISSKINKPFKRQYNLNTLVKSQASFTNYNSIQSKIAYIKCWLTIRNAGKCYFQVLVNKRPEKELIGIGANGLVLANLDSGSPRRIWQLSDVVTWNTNWGLQYMILEFTNRRLLVQFCSVSDCQCFHEYLGGYLFIMMRNSGKYSDLSEKTFRKLTARDLSKS